MVEPLPIAAQALREAWPGGNVTVHECAIHHGKEVVMAWLRSPTGERPKAGASSYVKDGHVTPWERASKKVHRRAVAEEEVVVEGKPFWEVDDGTIDLLTVDTEGSEWGVLATMRSRPKVIAVEMTGPRDYVNPNARRIVDWMKMNRYRLWGRWGSDWAWRR